MKSEEILKCIELGTDPETSLYTDRFFLGEIAAQLAIANEDRWPRWVWLSSHGNRIPVDAHTVKAIRMVSDAETYIYLSTDTSPWVVDGSVEEVCITLGIPLEGNDEAETQDDFTR